MVKLYVGGQSARYARPTRNQGWLLLYVTTIDDIVLCGICCYSIGKEYNIPINIILFAIGMSHMQYRNVCCWHKGITFMVAGHQFALVEIWQVISRKNITRTRQCCVNIRECDFLTLVLAVMVKCVMRCQIIERAIECASFLYKIPIEIRHGLSRNLRASI